MATQFDPYLQWLGIRDPQRPPNHYRLLGLELFEGDASVIAMSADRQMAHLRNFKTGPEADLAQRLLNELSAARICLLKPERKTAYDNQLRAALKPAAPARPVPVAAPTDALQAFAPVITTSGPSTRYTPPPAKAAWKPWAILAGLLILCVGLTALLISKNTPDENKPVATNGGNSDPPKPEVKPKPANVTPVKTHTTPDVGDKPGTNDEPKKENPKKVTPPDQEAKAPVKPVPEKASGNNAKKPPSKEQPTSTNTTTAPPSVDLLKLIGEEVESKPPVKPNGSDDPSNDQVKKPEQPDVAVAPPAEPEKPKRLAVPDKATITAKEKEIREIFAEEYKSQKPEVKATLAGKLKQSSADSKSDVAMRYVLLNEARSNAILGGSVNVAVEMSDELVRDYDVSESDERTTLFTKMLAGGNIPAAYYQQVLEELRKVANTLQANDEYDAALKLINMAAAAARGQRDTSTVTEMAQRIKEIGLQKTAYTRAKTAKDALVKNPADPAANESWGTFLTFIKGDFQTGMPFLARATGSENLASIAKRELAANKSPAEQLSLADDWWTVSEKLKDVSKTNVRLHAAKMYRNNANQAKGLDAAKIQKRLKEVESELASKQADLLAYKIELACKHPWKFPDGKNTTIIFLRDGRVTHSHLASWSIVDGKILCRMPPMHTLYNRLTAYLNVSYDRVELEWMEDGKAYAVDRLSPVE